MPTAATTSIVQHEGKTLLEIRLTIEIAMLGQQGVPSVSVEQKPEAHKKVDAIECGQDPEEKPAEPQAEQRHEIVIANTGMALSDHYDALLRERDIERRVSDKTVRDNKAFLTRFQQWLLERHEGDTFEPLQAMLQPNVLRHYAEHLRAQPKGNSSSMCSKALSTIGKLSAACVKARLIPFRPEAPTKSSVNMIRPRSERQRRVKAVPVTVDELKAMLAVVDGAKWPRLGKVKPSHFWRTNLLAHYVYGFRSQDWIACRTTDKQGLLWTGVIDKPECPLLEGLSNEPGWVWYLVHKTSKKDEAAERPSDVLAPLSVEMREMLEEFRGIDDARVFPISNNSATYSKEFQALLKRAGLSDKDRQEAGKPIIRLSLGQRDVASFRKGASAMWAKYAGRPAASYMLHHAVSEDGVAKMTAESYLQRVTCRARPCCGRSWPRCRICPCGDCVQLRERWCNMGDAVDGLRAVGIVRQHEKAERRQVAEQQFEESRQLAESFGLTLQRFSETHYRIRTEGMFWDIYPGNQRIRRSTPAVPFIFGLNSDWTLRDVVQQVENTLKAWREARVKAQQKGEQGGTST